MINTELFEIITEWEQENVVVQALIAYSEQNSHHISVRKEKEPIGFFFIYWHSFPVPELLLFFMSFQE